jgi:hypothetical protein
LRPAWSENGMERKNKQSADMPVSWVSSTGQDKFCLSFFVHFEA